MSRFIIDLIMKYFFNLDVIQRMILFTGYVTMIDESYSKHVILLRIFLYQIIFQTCFKMYVNELNNYLISDNDHGVYHKLIHF